MEMIKILIQAGGDINSQNEDGFTPLHVASMKGLVKAINSLIQAGVDVNCQNRIGSTALHVASRYHRVEVIWALLAAGADATIKDNRGYCAYDIAYENRCRGWWMADNANGRACMNALNKNVGWYADVRSRLFTQKDGWN